MTHLPVLLAETIAGLAVHPDATCIDGTLGGAGHAEALLAATAPAGRLLGLDLDPAAVARAQVRLAPFGERAVLVQASFGQMATIATAHGFTSVDAIVLDLGVSSFQLHEAARGFSFQIDGPLDMRMDPGATLSAAQIVNEWPQDALADLIYRYGEEPRSRQIARAIVAARPLHTTGQLAEVVGRAVGRRQEGRRIHPATRTFLALRVAVNDELTTLQAALPQMVSLLAPGGRFAVITFHSLEDRIVKQFIRRETQDCLEPKAPYGCPPELPACRSEHRATLRAITRKPIRPGEAEVAANPRSRSAKLRIAERLLLWPVSRGPSLWADRATLQPVEAQHA